MKQLITLKVNGLEREVAIEPWRTLADVLRDELNLTGTKVACGTGDCGACTVIVDRKAIKSCLYPAMKAKGKDILTIEGLASADGLHPLQQAFLDHFAVQCGYCTPGMVMAARALLDENPNATEDEIKHGLAGNICRCTGYTKILEAVQAAQAQMR